MELNEAIAHEREEAKEYRKTADGWYAGGCSYAQAEGNVCLEFAKEHEQLAEWLTELQKRREADRQISVKESNKRTPNKWLYHYDNLSQSFYWVCNKCNYKQSWGRFNYCPLCGADMRGEEK